MDAAEAAPQPGDHPTTRLWNHFDPDVAHRTRLPLLCGVPPQQVEDVMLISTARSRPAARLIARTPDIIRSLAHQTVSEMERCVGHVRGPIQWAETITAWSSGVGFNDVFVCVSPRRDFDVVENRMLVWVLRRLVIAGKRSHDDAASWFDRDVIDTVTSQAKVAQKFLEHRSLRGVPVRKLTGRERQLIRQSRHLATYAPVLKLADRVAHPFERDEAHALASKHTTEQHRAMVLLLDQVRARGHVVPLLAVRGDFLVTGPLRYRNPSIMVDRRISGDSGLFYGDVRVLSGLDPDPSDATTRPWARVTTPDEAEELVVRVSDAAKNGAQLASGLVQLSGS